MQNHNPRERLRTTYNLQTLSKPVTLKGIKGSAIAVKSQGKTFVDIACHMRFATLFKLPEVAIR